MTLVVGLRQPVAEWLDQAAAKPGHLSLLTAGVLLTEAVDHWIGVPEPSADMVRVQLHAPEPKPGEEPHWLEFRPGEWRPDVDEAFCCWTSDLIAVRVVALT